MFGGLCISFFVFLLIIFNFGQLTRSEDIHVFPYKSVELCKKSERYDLDTFQCAECDGKNSLLVPSLDRTSCVCQPNAVEDALYDTITHQPVCSNSTNCKSCIQPEQPRCKIKYIDSVKINRTANIHRIRIFHDDSTNCTCDTKLHYRYNDFCISIALLKNYHHYNTFQPDRQIYVDLKFIAFFCKALRNRTSCNHLANLCISSFYSLAKNSPCSVFYISQASDAGVYSEQDMDDIRPFVFYRKVKATQMELEKPIDYSYDLSGKKEKGSLRLVSSIHSLDGTLIRFANFTPPNINLCNRHKLSEYDSFQFGRNYEMNCKFTLDHLLEMNSMSKFYYSVYLNYTINKVQYLQPVPVLVRDAFKFNEAANPSDWQLVKRFQIYDSHKVPSSHHNTRLPFYDDSSRLEQFKMIRYIASFQMIVKIKDGNRISSPLIMLHYKTIRIHRNSSLKSEYGHRFSVHFRVGYNLNFYFELLLPLMMAVGLAFAILRTFNYKTRQNKEYYDLTAICQFILYLCSNCANALFAVVVFICFYVFFVHTGQSVVKLLVPIEQQNLIDVLVGVAFGLKTIYFIFFFSRITHSDIFFLDWERPRSYDALSTHRSNLDTPSVCSSVRSSTNGEAVSAWRNFFVANEWIRLSHRRRSSILFQNITVLICLEIINNSSDSLNPTNDKTLNLSLIMLTQFVLYAIQICVNGFLLEKIFGNPLQQFVDICSTANVSVFLLLHDSYGFYIHGRSPHGFSDVDMSSIILQLQREAHNVCGRRGLLTGSDNQNYVMLVPTDLRIYYNKLLTPFQKVACISQSHYEKEFGQNKGADFSLEKSSTAYSNINRFFCAFIDHSIKDLDYIIKDKTFIEILLNCEFESYLSETKGTFYIDNRQCFAKMLLYGNDAQLFLCSLLLFCFLFVISRSLILAAFVTCVMDQLSNIFFISSHPKLRSDQSRNSPLVIQIGANSSSLVRTYFKKES